jgi:hypothetical protein
LFDALSSVFLLCRARNDGNSNPSSGGNGLRCEFRDSGRYLGDHSIYQVTRFWNIVNETYRLADRYVGSFEIAGLRSFLNLQKFVRVHTRELAFVALPFFNEFVPHLPTCVAPRPKSLSHDVIATFRRKIVVLKGGVKHADNEKPRGVGGAKRPRLAPEADYLWSDCSSIARPMLMRLSATTPSPTHRFIPVLPL